MSEQIVYTANIRIERVKGTHRRAYLPETADPIHFGVHSEIAEHYNVSPDIQEPHATTLDHVMAAAAGWLTGTFGGALEARGIPAGEGYLTSQTKGKVGKDNNVLIIRSIHVTYTLKIAAEHHETAERVHDFHAQYCPVARSIENCIEISTALQMEPL